MALSLPRRLALGYGVGLVLLAGVAGAGWRSARGARADAAWVMHTYQVIDTLDFTLSRLRGVELGTGAYVLTGDARATAPYRTADADLQRATSTLRRLTSDNPRQQARLDTLSRLVQQELAMLARERLARMAGRPGQREFGSAALENERITDEIRRQVLAMRREEQGLLADRMEVADASAARADLTIGLGTVLSILFGAVSVVSITRELGARTRADAALRLAEAEARQVAEELAQSNAQLEEFASIASHDLQEPLRKVQAFADRARRLAGEELAPEAADCLSRAVRATERMQTLIDDLLAYARVSAAACAFGPVDLTQVAREVIADLEARIGMTRGEVVAGPLPEVTADAMQMRQLLQNLVGNALKFHRPGVPPVVTVRGERRDGPSGAMWAIVVADNGIGIDAESLHRIFVPFQRLHGRSEYEGTGMGLAICRKIAARHGGTITATSTPGQGSIFTASFPADAGRPGARAGRVRPSISPPGRSRAA